jgi:hypothetical protein
MNKSVFLLSVFAWLAITTFCYASPLEIEISLNESVSSERYEYLNADFFVATKITNSSNHDQEFWVWNCAYGWTWEVSTPAIITGIEKCRKNGLTKIILKPTEFYSKDLALRVDSNARQGPLTFQLGFRLIKVDRINRQKGILSKPFESKIMDVIWSNPLTLEVTKNMIK